jgi:hypothetical protein
LGFHVHEASGPEAARALIVSGFADVEHLDPCLHRLSKPFVQKDLAHALAALTCAPDKKA